MTHSLNLGACFSPSAPDDKVALIEPGKGARRTTYGQLRSDADAVARGLLARGLSWGDRVGLMALNSREYLSVFFGAMRAGLVAVLVAIVALFAATGFCKTRLGGLTFPAFGFIELTVEMSVLLTLTAMI